MCPTCGQAPEHLGGIGCQCNNCRCGLSADASGYCFMCRPCTMHGTAMMMHTGAMLDACEHERVKKKK